MREEEERKRREEEEEEMRKEREEEEERKRREEEKRMKEEEEEKLRKEEEEKRMKEEEEKLRKEQEQQEEEKRRREEEVRILKEKEEEERLRKEREEEERKRKEELESRIAEIEEQAKKLKDLEEAKSIVESELVVEREKMEEERKQYRDSEFEHKGYQLKYSRLESDLADLRKQLTEETDRCSELEDRVRDVEGLLKDEERKRREEEEKRREEELRRREEEEKRREEEKKRREIVLRKEKAEQQRKATEVQLREEEALRRSEEEKRRNEEAKRRELEEILYKERCDREKVMSEKQLEDIAQRELERKESERNAQRVLDLQQRLDEILSSSKKAASIEDEKSRSQSFLLDTIKDEEGKKTDVIVNQQSIISNLEEQVSSLSDDIVRLKLEKDHHLGTVSDLRESNQVLSANLSSTTSFADTLYTNLKEMTSSFKTHSRLSKKKLSSVFSHLSHTRTQTMELCGCLEAAERMIYSLLCHITSITGGVHVASGMLPLGVSASVWDLNSEGSDMDVGSDLVVRKSFEKGKKDVAQELLSMLPLSSSNLITSFHSLSSSVSHESSLTSSPLLLLTSLSQCVLGGCARFDAVIRKIIMVLGSISASSSDSVPTLHSLSVSHSSDTVSSGPGSALTKQSVDISTLTNDILQVVRSGRKVVSEVRDEACDIIKSIVKVVTDTQKQLNDSIHAQCILIDRIVARDVHVDDEILDEL
ncbi:RSBN1/Dpy-21 like protein [Aduncisulcus paluster]|uniref:RSBN1/Dpy-21 like protein n=1 Tax=Aduncisulcus paluster TaxID=2918883 RepID=A0ABQ5K362_9EUKA|nr:RSBN1/Dpy-21 like protein [Aduncisulcus paluster]